jgi:hypothetical protein
MRRFPDRRGQPSGIHGTSFGCQPVCLLCFGFFIFGVFAGYAIYLPELFPTQVRSTAVGFCTGTARVVTSFGPLIRHTAPKPRETRSNELAGHVV